MKKISYLAAVVGIALLAVSCNQTKKEPVEATDQTNTEKVEDPTTENKEPSNKEKVRELLSSFSTGNEEPLKYINPNKYIQHNLEAADGVEGFKSLMKSLSASKPSVNIVRMLSDGDYVVAQTEYGYKTPTVGFDIFRFENGLIVEHWDNLQAEKPKNPSGHTLIDGDTTIKETDEAGLKANKALAEGFVTDVLMGKNPSNLENYFNGNNYIQHHPLIGDGLDGLKAGLEKLTKMGLTFKYTQIHKILGEGNFVLVVSEGVMANKPTSFYDLFRIENGKIAEHWDIVETIPANAEHKNKNGKF